MQLQWPSNSSSEKCCSAADVTTQVHVSTKRDSTNNVLHSVSRRLMSRIDGKTEEQGCGNIVVADSRARDMKQKVRSVTCHV